MIILTLARTVIRLYRENEALRALAGELEDELNVRPTPDPDERVTLTPAGTEALDEALLEKRLGEALGELGRSRGTIERLEASAAGENRRRREAEAERDTYRNAVLEAHDALDKHGAPLSRLAGTVAERIDALVIDLKSRRMSTAEITDALVRRLDMRAPLDAGGGE